MNIQRNRIEEIREEFAEILIDRARCFHKSDTSDLNADACVNVAICELGRVLAMLLREGGKETMNGNDKADDCCDRVHCRHRK